MSQISLDFLNLFVRSPGDVIYFLVMIAISQAGLFMAIGQWWRRAYDRRNARYALVTLGIVLTWVVVMLGALYSVVSNQTIESILPPLERACNLIIILLCGWAFLTDDHNRWGRIPNIVLLFMMLIVIVGYVLVGVQWAGIDDQTTFNLSSFNVAWTFITLVFSLLGVIILLISFRVITDAPLKLLFFVVLVVGYAGTLLQISQQSLLGNYAGTSRLALFTALTILPVIIYRVILNQLQSEATAHVQTITTPGTTRPVGARVNDNNAPPLAATTSAMSPAQRDSIQLLKALGLILEDSTPGSIPERIVLSVLDVLKADIGAILNLQDANYADITVAHDKTMKRPIAGMTLNLDNQPTLVNAIERRSQRPLYVDRNNDELRDLYNRLDIETSGAVYFQPLTRGKDLVAVLMIGMPYTRRELEESERELLKGIGIIAGNLLALSYASRDARLKAEERAIQALVQGVPLDDITEGTVIAARQEMQASLQASREQITDLTRQVSQLKIELDAERGRVVSTLGDTEEGLSVSQRILTLTDEQAKLRDEREQLIVRLQEAETALAAATSNSNEAVFKHMIEVLRREKGDLFSQRENLQTQLNQIRGADQKINAHLAMQDVAEHMSQENDRMQAERDDLKNKLTDISGQLQALGIEHTTSGLAQLIAQLTEQRTALQEKIDSLSLERNALLNERVQHEDSIKHEKERATRIQSLETEIHNLASDREALTRERDQLRVERDELSAKQDVIKQNRARLLAEASAYQLELAEANQEQAKLRRQIQQLANEKSDLTRQHDLLRAEKQALEAEFNLLQSHTTGNSEQSTETLENGVGSLTRMIQEVSQQRNQMEHELNETRTQLAAVQKRVETLQRHQEIKPDAEQQPAYQTYDPELTLGAIQELRSPLSSSMGYIDLLMDESAGILGDMQRKFLQRVAANITRLSTMMDDLTRVTTLDTDRMILIPRSLDVVNLIEDTIGNASYQFREKGLAVHLNLDDNLPEIRADKDAIGQIVTQLLTNAYLVSPSGSQIFIAAQHQAMNAATNNNPALPSDCILISIEDRGGGIQPEDMDRVFKRKNKNDRAPIQGLGDSGIGLSITKTLVEAHGGSIWVETHPTIGSTFYVALPVKTTLEKAEG